MTKQGIIEDFPMLASAKREYCDLPVDEIHPGEYQPRVSAIDSALHELAATIVTLNGVIEPIVVRPRKAGGYEILAGERRWRATKLTPLTHIACCIGFYTNTQARLIALIENIQRKDINAWEEAKAIRSLVEDMEITHEAVADKIGKSRSHVSNLLRLLDADPVLQRHVKEGLIELGAAKAIMGVEDHLEQARLARIHHQRSWSVRQLEDHIKRTYKTCATRARRDADIKRLEQCLSDNVGYECSITASPTGKGKITFEYASPADLDNLLHNLERAKEALKDS